MKTYTILILMVIFNAFAEESEVNYTATELGKGAKVQLAKALHILPHKGQASLASASYTVQSDMGGIACQLSCHIRVTEEKIRPNIHSPFLIPANTTLEIKKRLFNRGGSVIYSFQDKETLSFSIEFSSASSEWSSQCESNITNVSLSKVEEVCKIKITPATPQVYHPYRPQGTQASVNPCTASVNGDSLFNLAGLQEPNVGVQSTSAQSYQQ